MRALVWHGPQEMSVDDVPDLAPAAGEVLLAPEAVGICGSELEGYLGHQANRTPPLVMGHEFAGRVVEPVQPLDAGPDAFAELAAGPSERLKVFLA